ncbi:uncharacterized protein LOC100575159 [Acyrthosiphon pisum]|uniref:Uncharacterized protein n=1 Tax=Acyrthosiphon pisum TaxID=7029 RepID=A0A8R2B2F1_ACYPI|nr:uncharacterized protein LOC100575159 [Acyrthosiphon pisum]|eukprot:XP_008178387.1 PREDICTED: uncharacterized protein LOC100575159 [Acyrthosiphon pisum]
MDQRTRNIGACCRDESKIVRCAVTALEKMRDYLFETSVCQDAENSSTPGDYGCVTDCKKYTTQECPFRGTGMPPNLMRTFCVNKKKLAIGRLGPNMIRLLPGQVGVAGDRATFHLGHLGRRKTSIVKTTTTENNGQSVAPTAIVVDRPTATKYINTQRKRTMQVLPAVPVSANNLAVGPVTGLPVDDKEHVFVLRLSKAYENPTDVACLQVEMRLPNPPLDIKRTDAETQFLNDDVTTTVVTTGGKKRSKKGSRKGSRTASKKGKK